MDTYPKGEDPFDEIVTGLRGDCAFSDELDEVKEMHTRAQPHEPFELYTLPHQEVSIDGVGERLYRAFQQLCTEFGIAPNNPQVSEEAWQELGQLLSLEAYHMKSELWEGDIIAARDAIIVDDSGIDDSIADIVNLDSGDRVVGTFYAPVIGAMPDDITVITRGEMGPPPVGIGLAIADPVIIDSRNQIHLDPFTGKKVIVALGTMGLQLGKYHFL